MSEKISSTSSKHFQYLPPDWKLDRLDKIVSKKITYGIVQPGKFDSSGIPLIRGVDYMSGWKNLNSFFRVSKNLHQKFKRSTTRKGDVLLSIAGYAGYVSVVPEWIEEANITQTTARISIEESSMSSHFVAYFLDSIEGKLQSRRYIKGSAQEGLNLDDVQKFFIPIPPLPEQKKITTILKSVDGVIENTQKQIDKLQDLKNATMNELLTKGIGHKEFKDSELGRIPKTWKCIKMQNLAKITDGAHKTPNYVNSGVPFLRVTDIQSEEINVRKIKYISTGEHLELCRRCNPEKGDILYSKNGTIGISKIVNWDWDFSIFVSLALLKLYDKNIIQVEYLNLFLQSPLVAKQIKDRAKQGTVTNLHLEEIRMFDVIVPSIEEQLEIKNIIGAIEFQIKNVKQKLSQTQSLKKSLMQDLLTGKVRVKVS